ncbi:hypothetical protein AMELA_G00229430, partial [Ameiurus melas]
KGRVRHLGTEKGHGEPGAYPRNHRAQGRVHPGQGASPSQGTITYTLTHPFIHYGHFRHANQPTMHVFGLGEETGVPGGNPRSTRRTCKLHTHMALAGIEPWTMEVVTKDIQPNAKGQLSTSTTFSWPQCETDTLSCCSILPKRDTKPVSPNHSMYNKK